eukprot:gb/GECG01014378.1/.p1 GENE.gb/GECG01014378.1/~~gb/GECG01014378.1/.p1  ORF type:complete len:100 (+),score=5.86 gb/GECG01014378.1/:1-300(+)
MCFSQGHLGKFERDYPVLLQCTLVAADELSIGKSTLVSRVASTLKERLGCDSVKGFVTEEGKVQDECQVDTATEQIALVFVDRLSPSRRDSSRLRRRYY